MRLEVFCEDRLGLTRELLDLLVLRGIDLRGIDIDPIGRIYLNFASTGSGIATSSALSARCSRSDGIHGTVRTAVTPAIRRISAIRLLNWNSPRSAA